MSRPREIDWKAAVMGYCAALLLSLGMGLTVFRAFEPQQALWPAALLCAGFTLLFQILFQARFPRKGLIFLGLMLLLGLWGLLGGGPFFLAAQMVKAAWLSIRGIPDAVAPYAGCARWVVCLIFSLLGAALYWDHTVPLAVFTVVSMVGLAYWFGAREELLLCALPGAAGLLLMMAREEGKRFFSLVTALALAAGAYLLLPQTPRAVSPFKEAAENVRHLVEDYLLFNEYRAAFTLASEGFQPLDERLGGPAEPEDHSVLEALCDRTVLLRGKTYDDYTGLNWYDTLSARRYLAVSPRFAAQREELFDLNRPLSGDGAALQTLRVHFLNSGTTTLFAPCRTRDLQLEGERMVLYYNTAGELFLTRNVEPGDAYTLTYLPYAPGDKATEAAVRASASLEDPYYSEIQQRYLQIPSHIQQEIYDIAARATQGAETPYEKALAIQNYLRRHYRYNLFVQEPPEGVDFVAWFLIGEQQGYCTYFATAMTMLCRIAGLPARYVTGYIAAPNDDGVALVTGEDAHAWTEVYLNGFGWLDFDATPRSDYDRSQNMGQEDQQSPPEEQDENGGQPSPEPSPSVSPDPSQGGGPQDTPTPEPSGDPSQEGPSPTPIPMQPPTAPPEGTNPPDENRDSFPWWLLLLILALIAALRWRFRATDPLRRAKKRPDQAAAVLFSAVSQLLALRGIRRAPQETLHDFAARADSALAEKGLPSLLPLVSAYAAQLYGRRRPDGAAFESVYLAFHAAASPLARLRLALKRMFSRAFYREFL